MKGDLSNVAAPLTMVQWEGVLALPPQERQVISFHARKNGKLSRFIGAFEPVDFAIKQLGDIAYRQNRSVRVFTTFDIAAVPLIREWLLQHHAYVAGVESCMINELRLRVALHQGVDRVVHSAGLVPFGEHGIRITDPKTEEFRY